MRIAGGPILQARRTKAVEQPQESSGGQPAKGLWAVGDGFSGAGQIGARRIGAGRREALKARAERLADKPFGGDGTVKSVDGITGGEGKPPVLFVNGAFATGRRGPEGVARNFGNKVGRQVDHVYNAGRGPGLDIAELTNDISGRAQSPASKTVTDRVLEAMRNGTELDVVGHSAGTAVIANGLRHAEKARIAELRAQGAADPEAQVREELSRISFLNTSGPVNKSMLPDGVNYAHAEIRGDPAAALGELSPPTMTPAERELALFRAVPSLIHDGLFGGQKHSLDNVLDANLDDIQSFLG